MANQYYLSQSSPKLRAALAQDIPALYAGVAAASTGANPTATIGLAAVNGIATTYARSDGAPALSQAIAPKWTGTHQFTGSLGYSTTVTQTTIGQNAGFPGLTLCYSAGGADLKLWDVLAEGATLNYRLINDAQSVVNNWMTVTRTGAATASVGLIGPLGINGASPPAQSTGWGTPTGAAVISNFPGASATTAQCAQVLAELISILKGAGFLGN